MIAEPSRPPRVLTVGAYERDNVGDLLFLLVTEQYLRDAEVVAAAPFDADMTSLLDRQVHAYGPLLQPSPSTRSGPQVGRSGAPTCGARTGCRPRRRTTAST